MNALAFSLVMSLTRGPHACGRGGRGYRRRPLQADFYCRLDKLTPHQRRPQAEQLARGLDAGEAARRRRAGQCQPGKLARKGLGQAPVLRAHRHLQVHLVQIIDLRIVGERTEQRVEALSLIHISEPTRPY